MYEPHPLPVDREACRSSQGKRQGSKWLIYETSDRWQRVVRRFAPEFFPPEQPLVIQSLGPITSDLILRIRQHHDPDSLRRIVLWQVERSNFRLALDAIATTQRFQPGDLQIAVVRNLPGVNQMALLETGVVTLLRHPEQFPKLRHLARVHFSTASFAQETSSQQRDHSSA